MYQFAKHPSLQGMLPNDRMQMAVGHASFTLALINRISHQLFTGSKYDLYLKYEKTKSVALHFYHINS